MSRWHDHACWWHQLAARKIHCLAVLPAMLNITHCARCCCCSYDNVVVAQFEKVTRTKNKWKCTLKDGIMQLNGRDMLFHTAAGEMQF